MKNLLCILFGHKPRGPVKTKPIILYRCERCGDYIQFDREQGWQRW